VSGCKEDKRFVELHADVDTDAAVDCPWSYGVDGDPGMEGSVHRYVIVLISSLDW